MTSEGKLRKVDVAWEGVVLANVRWRIYAISNCCTHGGAPLAEGVKVTVVVCPWHGEQFDITTGRVVSLPTMKNEDAFEVQIRGSKLLLKTE